MVMAVALVDVVMVESLGLGLWASGPRFRVSLRFGTRGFAFHDVGFRAMPCQLIQDRGVPTIMGRLQASRV